MHAEPQPPTSPSLRAKLWAWLEHLPLQYKAWLMTCVLVVCISVAMSMGVYHTFRRSFDKMESRQVEEHTQRLTRLIQSHLDILERSTRDYANWDDSVAFVQTPSKAYQEANLNQGTFDNLQLYGFLVFDLQGALVAGRTTNEQGKAVDADGALWTRLFAMQIDKSLQEDSPGLKGFLRLPDRDIGYYACLPIHQNNGRGSAAGLIIHIKRLDETAISELRTLTMLDIKLDTMCFNSLEPIEQALNKHPNQSSSAIIDDNWIAFHVPILDNNGRAIAHFHGHIERQLQQTGRHAQLILYTGIFSITVIAALMMVWLLRSLVIARLEKLNAEVRRVAEHADPDARVTLSGDDEISELGREINLMLEALVYVQARHEQAIENSEQLEAQLLQAQKMEAIGTMAGGLAHDFNNMLSSILGSADLLRYELPQNHPGQEHIRRIEKAGANASALVQQLLAVSRRQSLRPEPLRLCETIMDALRLLQAALPKNIEFHLQPETVNDVVLGEAAQLHQVIMNLATNAAHAMAGREKGNFTVVVQECSLPAANFPETTSITPGEYLRITLSDNGAGIPQENLERIFEPFFTTKPSGSGTGLGLAVVHGIIGKHNGCISVQSKPGQGTRFTIHLPRLETPHEEAPPKAEPVDDKRVKTHTESLTVLLVDDDRMVCDTLSNGLRRIGFTVHSITHTEEALRMIADPCLNIQVLITDQMMPGMNGLELGTRARTLRPGLPMILMSGYASSLEESHVISKGFSHMLMKPLTAGQIGQAIRSALKIEAASTTLPAPSSGKTK